MTEGVSGIMQDLTPVGLSKDGSKLVLVSSSGEEFAVAVDHRLRTALRGDNARLGQLEMKMESALRPRDIQTRIRAGESPEAVAAAAQTNVDAIMPFAAPVLAERAHVAQLAQGSSVRRRQGEAPAAHRALGDTAAAYFSDLGIRVDDVDWDAWRRDDGRWTLVANFGAEAAPQQAQFTFDQRGRYVVADNDEARMLTGELTRPDATAARKGRPAGRRLSSVPLDDQLPLGDGSGDDDLGADALELVREHEAAEETTDLSETAAAVREQPPETQPETQPKTQPEAVAGAPTPVADEPGTADGPEDDDEDAGKDAEGTADETSDEESAPRGRKGRRKGRSSVPSWDEIMFGGGKHD